MGFHSARSRVLSSNIANVDTPRFVPKDIHGGNVAKALSSSTSGSSMNLKLTDARHLPASAGGDRAGAFRATSAPDSETTLDGNAVVLEEQMAKIGEARMAHEAAVGLYQKSISLLRMAIRPPGR